MNGNTIQQPIMQGNGQSQAYYSQAQPNPPQAYQGNYYSQQYSQDNNTYNPYQSQQYPTTPQYIQYTTPQTNNCVKNQQTVVYYDDSNVNSIRDTDYQQTVISTTPTQGDLPVVTVPEQFANLKDLYEDHEEYKVSFIMRVFYIFKLLASFFFVAFVIFNVAGKYNNNFFVYEQAQKSQSTLYNTQYDYYLAKSIADIPGCKKLANKFYGDIIEQRQGYFLVPLIITFIWKAYYISFQFKEIWKGTIQGKLTYEDRNDIRQRDTFNFIIDYTTSISLSPFTAFIFSERNCVSWMFGDSSIVFSPQFFYLNSFLWCSAAFISLIGFMIKKEEGRNMRPLGLIMIVPMLTYRLFSFCTHYKIPPTVYRVTTYYYQPWGRDYVTSRTETDHHLLSRCLCKLIGIFGQFVLPFYEILGMILQFPFMLYYCPVYLIVYYGIAIVIFGISTQVHKRLGF